MAAAAVTVLAAASAGAARAQSAPPATDAQGRPLTGPDAQAAPGQGAPGAGQPAATANQPSSTPIAGPSPGPDSGQSTASAVQEVVVTGFRASIASAIHVKRDEVGIVDALKADDIASFPDNNLAEALQRIPGVSIDRDGGEGRTITVRGLNPSFTRVLVNGIEGQAATGGSDNSGGVNRGRAFDFNIFDAELFNSIIVRKTQAAEVEEGSLGATVDLETTRPFDLKPGPHLVLSAKEEFDEQADRTGPRLDALVADTFLDGKLGVLVSAAYTRRYVREEGYNSTRFDNGASSGGFCSPVGVSPQNPANSSANGITASQCAPGVPRLANTPANAAAYAAASAATTFEPRLPDLTHIDYDNTRLGITSSIQFRPTERTVIGADILYSDFKSRRQQYDLSAISFSRSTTQGGKPQTSVLQAQVEPDGDLAYGVFNGVDFRSSSRFDKLDTEFFQYSLNLTHQFSDRFRISALAGRSASQLDNPIQTTVTFDNRNLNGFIYDATGGGRAPKLTFPYDVNNPGAYTIYGPGTNQNYSEIRIRPQTVTNTLGTARLDGTYDIADWLSFKLGGDYKNYRFKTTSVRRGNQDESAAALPAGVDIASLSKTVSFGGSDFGAGLPSSFVVPDINKVASLYNIYCNCIQAPPPAGSGTTTTNNPYDYTLTGITNGNARQMNQQVSEQDQSYYGEFTFKGDWLFGRTLRGDFGARYVHTGVRSVGYQAARGGTFVAIKTGNEDFLPSLNLAYNLRSDLVLRFGASKVLARPELSTLQAGGSFSQSDQASTGSRGTITIGNPYLQPFRAKTVDLSLEWYFTPESLASVAYFHKDIDTYIQQLRVQEPFSQTGLDPSLLTSRAPTDLFDVTTYVNTQGGPLDGVELNLQTPLGRFMPDWIWAPLKGFGVLVNYTHVQSNISYVTSATNTTLITADLVQLSPNSYNATVFYEYGPLAWRVSTSYRDGYLTLVPGRNNNDVEGKNSTLNVDLSATYSVTPRLQLTFQALNLTDQYNDQYVSSTRDSPSYYTHVGRQYYAGVRYKF